MTTEMAIRDRFMFLLVGRQTMSMAPVYRLSGTLFYSEGGGISRERTSSGVVRRERSSGGRPNTTSWEETNISRDYSTGLVGTGRSATHPSLSCTISVIHGRSGLQGGRSCVISLCGKIKPFTVTVSGSLAESERRPGRLYSKPDSIGFPDHFRSEEIRATRDPGAVITKITSRTPEHSPGYV